MNYDYEIDKLKKAVANLNNTVLQMAKNSTPMVSKVDSTANGLSTTDGYVEKNTADIDYVAMMTDVELPE